MYFEDPWERLFSTVCKVGYGLIVGGGIVFMLSIASRQAALDECEQKLLYQQKQYRTMLKDTHRFYTIKMDNAATAEVICLDVENMTARELLWHMEDIFSDTEVRVGTQEAGD